MESLEEIAIGIDQATDAGDADSLKSLGHKCHQRLERAQGTDRVILRYYESNTYAAIVDLKRADPAYTWAWEQPEGVKNVLALRQAIAEPGFAEIDPIRAAQIRTNLGNRLNNLGRPIAAFEQWTQALSTVPSFAKALANRAQGMGYYAGQVYDAGHRPFLLSVAREDFNAALSKEAFWESGDRKTIAPALEQQLGQIEAYLKKIEFDEAFDCDQWSMGSTFEERRYREWCLKERLFLNPLNDAYQLSIAATDVLHLPDHEYRFDENPRFPAYFNVLKHEFVSARYRLYRAIHEEEPEAVLTDVLLLDSGEGQVFGYWTEELRSAFRAAYSLFDKIALFLNDYYALGIRPSGVSFRNVWVKSLKRQSEYKLRTQFLDRKNWILRGLYFLSKDLFSPTFNDVTEPDAKELASLRNMAEHRYLSFQQFEPQSESTEFHEYISVETFEAKTLRLLRTAREALIYLSLAMHREEQMKDISSDNIEVTIPSFPITNFQR